MRNQGPPKPARAGGKRRRIGTRDESSFRKSAAKAKGHFAKVIRMTGTTEGKKQEDLILKEMPLGLRRESVFLPGARKTHAQGDREPTSAGSADGPPPRKNFSGTNDSRRPSGPRPASAGNAPRPFEKKWNRKEKHEFYGERKKRPGRYAVSSPRRPLKMIRRNPLNKFISIAGVCSRRKPMVSSKPESSR
jgi:hypothetical protein